MARTWRAWLSSGAELEITLAHPAWASVEPLDQGTRRVMGDGARVLVDKDGLLRRVTDEIALGR